MIFRFPLPPGEGKGEGVRSGPLLKVEKIQMLVGDPSIFAIESGIYKAYKRLHFRAWGFFVIHVKGRRYGVYEHDATTPANSLDEVEKRIARLGKHTAPFAAESNATEIAYSYRNAFIATNKMNRFLGCLLLIFVSGSIQTILHGHQMVMKHSMMAAMCCSSMSRIA